MKRIYTALAAFLMLFVLLVGLISTFDKDATYSEAEKRQLKTLTVLILPSTGSILPIPSPTAKR